MGNESALVLRIVENPFYVLGVGLECSRHDFEREGKKLLSMLELDLSEARMYDTPLGPRPRTPELVRFAMAELRDPSRRLLHELLATLPASSAPVVREINDNDRWPEAPTLFGYGPARALKP